MIAGWQAERFFSQRRPRVPNAGRRGVPCWLRALAVAALAGLLALLGSCQGLPANVANCPITPTPPANTSLVPPATEPPPQPLCGFPLTTSSPGNGASLSSPATIVAAATPPDQIYTMRLYVDGQAVLYSFTPNINQYIWMPNGPHTVEVVAEDVAGYIATSSMQVNVTTQEPGVPNIQNLPIGSRVPRCWLRARPVRPDTE